MIVRLKHVDLVGLSTFAVQQMLIERGLDWRTAKAHADHTSGEIVYEGEPMAGSTPPAAP
jgi:hypothetical protein